MPPNRRLAQATYRVLSPVANLQTPEQETKEKPASGHGQAPTVMMQQLRAQAGGRYSRY